MVVGKRPDCHRRARAVCMRRSGRGHGVSEWQVVEVVGRGVADDGVVALDQGLEFGAAFDEELGEDFGRGQRRVRLAGEVGQARVLVSDRVASDFEGREQQAQRWALGGVPVQQIYRGRNRRN